MRKLKYAWQTIKEEMRKCKLIKKDTVYFVFS